MEKLQKAIAQARKERQGQSSDVQPRGGSQSTRNSAPSQIDVWSDLTALQYDTRALTRKRIVSHESTPVASSFDVLRTKVLQQMQQNGWKRLVITSPTPGCGKTTLAANLGFGIARHRETSAIVMELDLRRPSLAQILGQAPDHDIRDVLMGDVAFGDQAMRVGSNVAFSIANRPSSDPTRYLTSHNTNRTLQDIQDVYEPEVMIFDTPPLLYNDDTSSFLPNVDCVLLVARSEVTTSKQIDICEREIASTTNMIGVVLNQCRHADRTDGYSYGDY